jgi:hypothetical protein
LRSVIVLVLLVFVSGMPVSADLFNGYYRVAPVIEQGATVFIGEQGLDISPAMTAANVNGVPTSITTIGWWASAADIRATVPTKSIDLAGRENVFSIAQAEFDGYEGWHGTSFSCYSPKT